MVAFLESLASKRAEVGRYLLVRAERFGEGGGATRARAVASYRPVLSWFVPGRVAQRESACFTRKRSQVQSLSRPLPPLSSLPDAEGHASRRGGHRGRGGAAR